MTERIGPLPPEGLGVGGAILIGDPARSAEFRRDLWLTFTVEGIRVHSSEQTGSSLLAWSGLDAARCAEQVLLPDGRGSTVLELTSEGQFIRFLLPHDQLTPRQRDYLEDAVPVWLTAYGRGTVPAGPVPPQPRGAVHQPAPSPAATQGQGTAVPLVDGGWRPSPPPPSPPPGGTGQTTPLGSSQATVTDQSWVPAGTEALPFVPPPPAPGPGNALTVDPGTRNGSVGDSAPEPATHPPTPSPAAVPVDTGFAAPGLALFEVRGEEVTAGGELDQPREAVRPPRASFGRRSTDRPPEDDAVLGAQESADSTRDDDEAEENDEGVEREQVHHRWWVLTVVVVVLIAAVAGGYLLYTKVLHAEGVPAATPADRARAASINLRLTDLPSGFSVNAPVPPGPPAAPAARRVAALGTLARCLGQPRSSVRGWFGTGSFPDQITSVRSPTFGNPTAPTVQMSSTTALMVASINTSSSLEAALGSPKFPACYGQFEVAALAVPVTGQVQAFGLTPPSGVRAYGYQTMFTLADGATELVGDAFIVGSGVVTLLQLTTQGPSVPTAYFDPAFQAVAGRVAVAQP